MMNVRDKSQVGCMLGNILMLCCDVMDQEHYGPEATWLQRKSTRIQRNVYLHTVLTALTVIVLQLFYISSYC